MKIKMVGTGSMVSPNNPACYLINDKIMIDMPNGIVKVLKNLALFDKVEYVFITHMHGDHIFDLPFLFLDRVNEDKELTVFINKRWYKNIKKLVKLAFPRQYYNIFYNSKIKFVTNEKEYQIDDLIFSSFEVCHGNMKPSFGYVVKDKETIVTFTGDSGLCDSIREKLSNTNLLISDCTLREGNNKHIGVDNIKNLIKEYPNVKFITSHMSINAKKELLKLKEDNLIIKEDLEEFEV